jgi:hypothetical protein
MKTQQLGLIGTIFVLSVLAMPGEAAQCFTPLSDRTSRNPADFQDLAKNTDAVPMPGVVRFLPLIASDTKAVNIDFYYIKFTRPRTGTPEALFKELRLNYNAFAEGSAKDFGFEPYAGSNDSSDPIRKKNAALWQQDVPLKAVMSFKLDTPLPATKFSANRLVRAIIHKRGDLQVTCATRTDFVFSTQESQQGGSHPVSGNRGFGLVDNGDGTWMFYSKAVDRRTGMIENSIGEKVFRQDVFCLGHKFWLLFYSDMRGYLETKGIKVQEIWTNNHGPVPFPFGSGAQPANLECK